MALLTFDEDGMQRQDEASGWVLDMSSGGVRVLVGAVLRVGADIRIQIATEDALLDVAGRVVHASNEGEERQVLGLQFVDPVQLSCIDA